MDRLSGIDASFLYLESATQLMHTCELVVLDVASIPGGYSFRALRDEVEHRVRDTWQFTRRLRRVPWGLDHPVWERDREFDIDRHVHRLALPRPGGEEELRDLVAHLASLPLDRSRPLWQMWVIEEYHPDRVAVLVTMHQATVDETTGATLVSHLSSTDPHVSTDVTADAGPPRAAEPGTVRLLGRGLLRTVGRPWRLVGLAGTSVALLGEGASRARRRRSDGLAAPRTSFNGTLTGRRAVAFAELALSEIRRAKGPTGTTVDDVLLTVAGGALRGYLADRGELPADSLVASVPVSVRASGDDGEGAVAPLLTGLGTDIEDPLERLEYLAEQRRGTPERQRALPAAALQEWADFAASRTFALTVRAYAALRLAERHPVVHNLVLSNVPGPQQPLHFLGARVSGLYGLGPVFHGAGLTVTLMSNAGTVYVGANACRELMPRVGDLVDRFAPELQALVGAVEKEQQRVRRRQRARSRAGSAP